MTNIDPHGLCSDTTVAEVLRAALDVEYYGYASDYRVKFDRAVKAYREHITTSDARSAYPLGGQGKGDADGLGSV